MFWTTLSVKRRVPDSRDSLSLTFSPEMQYFLSGPRQDAARLSVIWIRPRMLSRGIRKRGVASTWSWPCGGLVKARIEAFGSNSRRLSRGTRSSKAPHPGISETGEPVRWGTTEEPVVSEWADMTEFHHPASIRAKGRSSVPCNFRPNEKPVSFPCRHLSALESWKGGQRIF